MHVLVTGATGLIGNHLLRLAAEAGHRVTALVRSSARAGVLADLPVESLVGDVEDPASLRAAMDGVEAVFHTAADMSLRLGFSERQHRVNVVGTRNVLAAARDAGVRRVVHTSSAGTVGKPPDGTVGDETLEFNIPPGRSYIDTKRQAEGEVRRFVDGGLDAVIVNPTFAYGPGDNKWSPVARMLVRRRIVAYPPGGLCVADVRDVARGHLAALEHGRCGERYLLGGTNVTTRRLLRLLAAELGAPPPRLPLPGMLVRAAPLGVDLARRLPGLGSPAAAGPVGRLARALEQAQLLLYPVGPAATLYYSSAKAERELGYRVRPLEQTVRDAIAWYREVAIIP